MNSLISFEFDWFKDFGFNNSVSLGFFLDSHNSDLFKWREWMIGNCGHLPAKDGSEKCKVLIFAFVVLLKWSKFCFILGIEVAKMLLIYIFRLSDPLLKSASFGANKSASTSGELTLMNYLCCFSCFSFFFFFFH